MCGIVGADRRTRHRAAAGRGPQAPRVPRLRFGRHGGGRRPTARWAGCAPSARCACSRRSSRRSRSPGGLGIAHTRWATHGAPSERNAHPHISRDGLAIVHNGIIENHEELRDELKAAGYQFDSETDTEVVAHRIHYHMAAARRPVQGRARHGRRARGRLRARRHQPAASPTASSSRAWAARSVVGLGEQENFVASDVAALLPVTRRFMFLEEGDVAEVTRAEVRIFDREGNRVERADARERAVGRCRREGPVPALHAQGNPRAAARRRRYAAGARRQRRACSRPRSGRPRPQVFGARRKRAHRRLRHELPRRHRRALLHRAVLPAAVPRRDRERIPLPQPGRAAEVAAGDHLAVGRDRRHAGGDAARQAARVSRDARHLQRARELAGARIGPGDADARRSRDRRRLDQGVHDPAGRARHARDRARPATTAPAPSSEREPRDAADRAARASSTGRSSSTA